MELNSLRLHRRLDETLDQDLARGKVGAAAVLVAQHGSTVYERYAGNDGLKMMVTADTQFRMASMTKPVTAVAVLRLVEQGRLALTDPVSRYLSDFQQPMLGAVRENGVECIGPSATEITIFHLLTHTSGLGSGPVGNYYASERPQKSVESLEAAVQWYASLALDFEPGTANAYSGVFGFDVLARIVELVSGMDYEHYLQQEILEPLKMYHTTFRPDFAQWQNMIPMHGYEHGRGIQADFPENCLFEYFPVTYTAGGAGLTSTLGDYARFAQMLLNQGILDGERILKAETVAQMATPQLSEAVMPGNQIWGLGVRVITKPEYQWLPVGTFGWSGAYGTHFWVDPENDILAVYLKNSRYDGGSGAHTALVFEQDVHSALEV